MKFSPVLLLVTALALSSCGNVRNLAAKSRDKRERERLQKLTSTSAGEAESRLGAKAVGEVASVNTDEQFALLRPLVGIVIPAGTELETRRANTKTGQLKVTTEKKSLFAVADLLQGSPQAGDAIFVSKTNKLPPPAPATVPASSLTLTPSAAAGRTESTAPKGNEPLLPPPSFESNTAEPAASLPPMPAAGPGTKAADDDFDPTNLPALPGKIDKPDDVIKRN